MLRNEELKRLLVEAREAFLAENYEECLPLVDKMIEMDDEFADAYLLRSEVLFECGKFHEALNAAYACLKLAPENAAAHHAAAKIFLRLGLAKSAIPELTKAILYDADKASLYYFDLGEANSILGEKEKAAACFREVLEMETDGNPFLRRGHQHMKRKEVGLAIWDFVHANEITKEFTVKAAACKALHHLLLSMSKNEILNHIKEMSSEEKKAQLLDMCLNQEENVLYRQFHERKETIDPLILTEVKSACSPKSSPRGSSSPRLLSFLSRSGSAKKVDLRGSGERLVVKPT